MLARPTPIVAMGGESYSLTTTSVFIPRPSWATEAILGLPVDATLVTLIRPTAILFYDDSASGYVDGTGVSLFDNLTLSVSSMTSSDFLYVVYPQQTSVLNLAFNTLNANASVLTVEYYNGSYTAVSGLSDGTSSGGATFGQNSSISWTKPTDEVQTTVTANGIGVVAGGWVYRLSVSATLDASTVINRFNARYHSYPGAAHFLSGSYWFDVTEIAGFEVAAVTGSSTGYVAWMV